MIHLPLSYPIPQCYRSSDANQAIRQQKHPAGRHQDNVSRCHISYCKSSRCLRIGKKIDAGDSTNTYNSGNSVLPVHQLSTIVDKKKERAEIQEKTSFGPESRLYRTLGSFFDTCLMLLIEGGHRLRFRHLLTQKIRTPHPNQSVTGINVGNLSPRPVDVGGSTPSLDLTTFVKEIPWIRLSLQLSQRSSLYQIPLH